MLQGKLACFAGLAPLRLLAREGVKSIYNLPLTTGPFLGGEAFATSFPGGGADITGQKYDSLHSENAEGKTKTSSEVG